MKHSKGGPEGGVVRGPSQRALAAVVGACLAVILPVEITVAYRHGSPPPRTSSAAAGGYIADAMDSGAARPAVAPLTGRLTPHLLVAAPATIPAATVGKIRGAKGVKAVEIVDAARALVAGKRVGLLGVDPSSFRAYTPKPTARSDALWGNVAVSFVLGSDGGVRLGATVPAGGRLRQQPVRIGAYATMGIGEVDAVTSRAVARSIGMPSANALIVSAPGSDLNKLAKALRRALPRAATTTIITPGIDYPKSENGGRTLTSRQLGIALRAARSQLGVPYVWGGESLAEGGYDCSGLVQWSFARAGIAMPRVAADQARTGPRLPFGQARLGDLLFWTNDPTAPGYISHEAIYLGGGLMLVAPHTGDVVKIQQVYLRNFWGAVRVDPRVAARVA